MTRNWKVVTALLVSIAGSASAHDTWLLPSKPVVAPGSTITLDLTSGMAFPANEHGPKADRIENAVARMAGRTTKIVSFVESGPALRLSIPVEGEGVVTIGVETKPKEIELTREQVNEYLDEIGARQTVGVEWKRSGLKTWRELYTKLAKTIVRAGDARGDRSWSEPLGQALEIVPESDPSSIRENGVLTVRVLLHGQPLPGFPLGLVSAGEKKGVIEKTDAAGRATFRVNRSGCWLLRGTRIVRSSRSNADWESLFATLTIWLR